MAGEAEEVHLKVHEADGAELLVLEHGYVEKKDWYSAMIVASAILNQAIDRVGFIGASKRQEKYNDLLMAERKKTLV